jgi:hypothetical protein
MRSTLITLTSTALCFISDFSYAYTLEELRGISITIKWTQTVTYRTSNNWSQWVHRTGEPKTFRIYISSLGNIFDDEEIIYRDNVKGIQFHKTTIDKVIETGRGDLYTWAFIDGRLTQLTKAIEGIRVYTINIDPTKSTCQFSAENRPDERTGRYIWPGRGPEEVQVTERTVEAYTCTIIRGNAFLLDEK